MASLNRCTFIGNLTRDPEIRYSPAGDAVTNYSIACNESWKDKNGQKQERVEYVRISMFGKLAEIAGEYLKKGSSGYIEGRLQTREWQDKEGNKRQTTEVVADRMQMLGGRGSGGSSEPGQDEPANTAPPAANPAGTSGSGFDDFEDDIPF